MAVHRLAARLAAMGLVLAALLLLGAACGGGGQPAGSIKVSMQEFKFNPNSIQTKSGKVVFYLVNDGSTGHDMVIVDSSNKQLGRSELVQAGNSSTFTVDSIAAGSYTFFCDVAGHREAGMEGTLTVS